MNKYLSYNNICLVPKYSELNSRAEADTSVDLCGFKFNLPIVPANMETVIDEKIAEFLSNNGYFYIMHRFNTNKLYDMVVKANDHDWKLISISCGVNECEWLYQLSIRKQRIDFITIDVAAGHHLKVKNRIAWLKENFPNTKIIAGNIATPEAARDLISWGADVLKVGIAGGSICSTKYQTGFHVPMFSCVKNIFDDLCPKFKTENYGDKKVYKIASNRYYQIPIIADGSISNIGDIAKSLSAGATMCMAGRLFAECIDSPAKIINGKKQYYGSTSFEAKKVNNHIEGKLLEIDFGVTIGERLNEIKMGLQSAISYAGGTKIFDLRNVEYIEV